MDNLSNNTPSNIEARPFSVGVALREARERLGLNVADVANRLKFAPRQIEALEEDNFARLPEMAFVRGFVRSYAKLLQLDAAPLLAALPHPPSVSGLSPVHTIKAVRFPNVNAMRKPNMVWLAAGLAVAVLLGLFIWVSGSAPVVPRTKVESVDLPIATEQGSPAEMTAAPTKSYGAASGKTLEVAAQAALVGPPPPVSLKFNQEIPSAAARQTAPIHLKFNHDAWVEITDKNGIYLMSQLNSSGSERWVKGNPPFTLTIGNASGVQLHYLGKAVDLAPYNRAEVAHLTLD